MGAKTGSSINDKGCVCRKVQMAHDDGERLGQASSQGYQIRDQNPKACGEVVWRGRSPMISKIPQPE